MSDVATQIERASTEYPRASAVVAELLRSAKTLFNTQVQQQLERHGDAFWREAERLIGYSDALGGNAAEALTEYTFAYLKEQALFLRTGEYSNSDFDEVARQVYANPDVMQRFYLSGLMLTHAFWPIHFDLHEFFLREFVPRIPNEAAGAEFGFGHGLYLLEVLSARPGTSARGYDISEFSVSFAARLLAHCGIEPRRFELGLADVRKPLAVESEALSWAVFAEIVEHIPDPRYSLSELRRCMKRGAPLFATTVLESNALDHIYQFSSLDEVRALMRETGFEIHAERVLRVRDYDANARDPSTDIALICSAR